MRDVLYLWLLLLCASCLTWAAPVTARWDAYPAQTLLKVVNGTVSVTQDGPTTVYRWSPNPGETSLLGLHAEIPLLQQLREYDLVSFEYRIAAGEISEMGLSALGHVSGPRQYKEHHWSIAVTTTPRSVWHTCQLDLSKPNWFPWEEPDGRGAERYFQFTTMALVPGTIVEFRNIRFQRMLLLLKPNYELPITWPVKTDSPDGSATYTLTFQLVNSSGKPARITPTVRSTHQRFSPTFTTPVVEVKAGQQVTLTLTATISAADILATEELYAEPLEVAFLPQGHPEAAIVWQGELVRPLSKTITRQVILTADDLATARAGLQANPAAMSKLVGLPAIRNAADAFCGMRLEAIPVSHNHPANNYPKDWRPADVMPAIINTRTGEREYGTALAGLVWKEYLGHTGRTCENLGMAYLLTGEEKYAQKAIELFTLYARQYAEQPWYCQFDVPWHLGPPILSSSRVNGSSTYGSNWSFRYHCRLLSMIADSPSWTGPQRKALYQGFVLPYTAELMKFYGGISNMTDITNHNILLLGLVFDDAGLVRWATMRDQGLITRLHDIDADGFSSEGRPLNYHYAAMEEYLPSIGYLANSGLPVPHPKERLLAAMRMPLARATLTGLVPNTGDCARYMQVGPHALADQMVTIFPQERWLLDIGRQSTLASRLRVAQAGINIDPNAWKALLEMKPRLFKETGLAVLRTGETPETQIQVTLDYGRNLFHAALDRNQITLAAFGKLFSHGPGSLYNVGSGGMTRVTDPKLESFCTHGSLGQNVVLVDMQDQMPAIGKLLAWSPKPEFQVAVAQVDGIRPGVSHTRGVALTNGLVVVLDRLASSETHTYDFVYHNLGTMLLGKGWTAEAVTEPLAKTANYENLQAVQRIAGTGAVHLVWDLTEQLTPAAKAARATANQPPQGMWLNLWQVRNAGSELYTAVSGMNNPNTQTVPDRAPSLIQRVRGNTATFVTVLEPRTGATCVQAVSAQGSDGVLITLVDGKQLTVSLDALVKQYRVP